MSEGELKLELLLDLGTMIAREVELDELLNTVGERVAEVMNADRATVWLLDAATGELRSRVAVLPELSELRVAAGTGVVGYVVATGTPVNVTDAQNDARWAPEIDQKTGYKTETLLAVPLRERGELPGHPGHGGGRILGALQVLNKRDGPFTELDESFLVMLSEHIARAFEYTTLRAGETRQQGVPMRGPFNHIVGKTEVMASVYEKIVRAAATDATVLLHGETGSGKGLFARAIHVNSGRRDGPLVAIDCTTLPANLVESELFGHERGAYTGADRSVVGKVEQAVGGTLFLDELGELPLPLQGKLLRFLQERRFERVGGRKTLEADVRIVAATNRNLEELVQRGEFRADLYYRVRVIDIALPPLRDRGPEDITTLAEHFLGHYARRYDKGQMSLAESARSALVSHTWPGNVRELEHAIERAVVLSPRPEIDAGALGLRELAGAGVVADGDVVPLPHDLELAEVERRYAAAELERHEGNRSATARALGIGRNKLARLLSE